MAQETRRSVRDQKRDGQRTPDDAQNTRRIATNERTEEHTRRDRNEMQARIALLRENDLYERQDS